MEKMYRQVLRDNNWNVHTSGSLFRSFLEAKNQYIKWKEDCKLLGMECNYDFLGVEEVVILEDPTEGE